MGVVTISQEVWDIIILCQNQLNTSVISNVRNNFKSNSHNQNHADLNKATGIVNQCKRMQFYLRVGNMVINSVSDWFQFVSLQLLSDTIEHTLHSVGGKMCSMH